MQIEMQFEDHSDCDAPPGTTCAHAGHLERTAGGLAIHAAKRWKEDQVQICYDPLVRRLLKAAGYRSAQELPRGVVLCTAKLQTVTPTERLVQTIDHVEKHLGDYSSGRYGWRLTIDHVYDDPPAATGRQRLWTWTQTTSQ